MKSSFKRILSDLGIHVIPKKRMKRVSSRSQYIAHKELARKLVHQRLAHFNAMYGFEYKRVSIKDQKTMWGSCSKKGNLNFNWRLVQLPPELADYVIVHELCHLKELNHSKQFWSLVALSIPEYAQRRRSLRVYRLV